MTERMKMMDQRFEVCSIKQEHLSAVSHLEAECFAQPWSEKSLALLLADEACGFVGLLEGEVVAYGGMFFAPEEGQITNIAVSPVHRRKGYGKAILEALLRHAPIGGARCVFLEVRTSNLSAISLYERAGFLTVGTRRNFYTSPREDALVMRCDLTEQML